MAGIGRRDSAIERFLRSGLHGMGYRFKVDDASLPGRPDLVFPRFRAVMLVNGCFWHGHDCDLFKWPSNNREKWRKKLEGNRERDRRTRRLLRQEDWRVLEVWECALRGPDRLDPESVLDRSQRWLESGGEKGTIRGRRRTARGATRRAA